MHLEIETYRMVQVSEHWRAPRETAFQEGRAFCFRCWGGLQPNRGPVSGLHSFIVSRYHAIVRWSVLKLSSAGCLKKHGPEPKISCFCVVMILLWVIQVKTKKQENGRLTKTTPTAFYTGHRYVRPQRICFFFFFFNRRWSRDSSWACKGQASFCNCLFRALC